MCQQSTGIFVKPGLFFFFYQLRPCPFPTDAISRHEQHPDLTSTKDAPTFSNCLLLKIPKEQHWRKNTGFSFHSSCAQYFSSFFPSSFINVSYPPSACHTAVFLHLITINVIPPSALFFSPTLSVFCPALSCSIHLSPSFSPLSPHRFVNTVRSLALTRCKHTLTHTAVPTSPQWSLQDRLFG